MTSQQIFTIVFQLVLTGGIGIITYFLKRTMDDIDKCKSGLDKVRENYVSKDEFDKCKTDITDVKQNYLTKEDFYREQLKTEQKLDKIMDILMEMKGNSMDMEKQKQLIRAGNFKENNGSVMRTINMLRYQYHKLKSVEYALPDITKGEITDSVNYLYEAGYIHLRTVLSKEPSTLADSDFDELEAKLTAKGISLLAGGINDPCIKL